MYLRLERLRRDDDKLVAVPHLVNMDWAADIEVERITSKADDPLYLSIQFAPAGASVSYYFGPADMTDEEQEERREAIRRRLNGAATATWWSKDTDDAARAEGRPLTTTPARD